MLEDNDLCRTISDQRFDRKFYLAKSFVCTKKPKWLLVGIKKVRLFLYSNTTTLCVQQQRMFKNFYLNIKKKQKTRRIISTHGRTKSLRNLSNRDVQELTDEYPLCYSNQ